MDTHFVMYNNNNSYYCAAVGGWDGRYEPALHSMLLSMMRKVFLQLLAEIRSLGSEVV
jgi:hypothetical protein